ncbi:uncharacterized protein EV420DRAFT_892714 [Desarmillaria tabescens]|uniref:Heterokaryon incompatibility domain-containing protein n=1 Tax=Armillaria tabescens TaxID=1929756 RepID=A0AA39JQA5_ARMTA|nr:uncharacterized protein EV420DRAFT_892714 [Desarmillaria tabescens]KAK0446532.1 hypothetical protein EV420DRAFT_892714 [Desarmillaria tabescens]
MSRASSMFVFYRVENTLQSRELPLCGCLPASTQPPPNTPPLCLSDDMGRWRICLIVKFRNALQRWMYGKEFRRAIECLEAKIMFLKCKRLHHPATVSAFIETGIAETSIKVPMQRSYTGNDRVIPSSLANVSCASLGIDGLLDWLNSTLGTTYPLDTPSISSLLETCITNEYDFGTAYGYLRPRWYNENWTSIQDTLRISEAEDKQRREQALIGNRIVNPHISPRRVWDLYSNRVVPQWILRPKPQEDWLWAISHAWMDEKSRVKEWTPINGKEWPVPIPADTNLNFVRIEMLNLGAEYAWLDVLCLRQAEKDGSREDIREDEWKLDVPTIGRVYQIAKNTVVYNLSGLGRPLAFEEGDLESPRCWFRRAWTLQETVESPIFAGDMPDGPLQLKQICPGQNDVVTKFHKQLGRLKIICCNPLGIFGVLTHMKERESENPVDKVAGLAFPLRSETIPAYREKKDLEDAWTALVDVMGKSFRGQMFFLYPEPGVGSTKWRPSWDQIMTKPLPVDCLSRAEVYLDDKTRSDCCKLFCIEQGLVKGLNTEFAEGADRCGELIVEGIDGTEHTFKIVATHKYPIPEGTYTLLRGRQDLQYWVVGRRLPQGEFEKVSVFTMSDKREIVRLKGLDIAKESLNILV